MANFKIKLKAEDGGFIEAFMGVDKNGWIVLASESAALTFTELPDKPGYLLVAKGELSGRWLSIRNAYLGIWSDEKKATTWAFVGNQMVSDYNGHHVSYYGERDGFVYAWDKYKVLTVTKVAVDATEEPTAQPELASVPPEPMFTEAHVRGELEPVG